MADSLLASGAGTLMDDNHASEDTERAAIIAKWKDKPREELEYAKAESDLFIKNQNARFDDLKKDYLELRERHQAGTELKDLIDQLKSKPQQDDNSQLTNQGQNQPAIKPEDLDTLVSQRVSEQLTAHQQTLTQRDNLNSVQAKLKEHFGEDYQSVYKQRLDNLGLTREYADELARTHPQVFLKTFELDTTKTANNMALPRTQQRPGGFSPSAPKRDWNYYQELKKTNPKLYLDPKIAIQMHDDAISLGDAFGMPMD